MSYDPTRTTMLRQAYLQELMRFFNTLDAEIKAWFENYMVMNASFPPEMIEAFEKWVAERIDALLPKEKLSRYINKSYDKGAERAYKKITKTPLRAADKVVEQMRGFKQGWYSSSNTVSKLEALHRSNLNSVEGLTERVKRKIKDIMAEGILGDTPDKEIASRISKEVKQVTKSQAKRIVNTEMVRAHAEGALDSMEQLGVQNIEVDVEWTTAGDSKVCPKCRPLAGIVIPVKEARGMFPRHPNCRCSPVPVVDQSPSKSKIRSRIKKSIEAGMPSTIQRSFSSQKRMETWKGKRLLRK